MAISVSLVMKFLTLPWDSVITRCSPTTLTSRSMCSNKPRLTKTYPVVIQKTDTEPLLQSAFESGPWYAEDLDMVQIYPTLPKEMFTSDPHIFHI